VGEMEMHLDGNGHSKSMGQKMLLASKPFVTLIFYVIGQSIY
jgi:hypothetical protein